MTSSAFGFALTVDAARAAVERALFPACSLPDFRFEYTLIRRRVIQ
jgi:hypothetical protein